ncbi:MAG: hypothetical protein ACQESH_04720 [Campylobacterota bacterium]
MQKECFERSQKWAEIIKEQLQQSLYKHVKFDVKISIALVSVEREIESLSASIRNSDTALKLDSCHHMVFYHYTDIDESHFAIKNLYKKLDAQKLHPKIVCTEIKATDRYPEKLFARLCAISCEVEKQDEKFLSLNKLEEGMDIYDVDLDDF